MICSDGLPSIVAVRRGRITQQEWEDALERYICQPPKPRGFANFNPVLGRGTKSRFASVPPHLKHFAESWLDRALRKLKREGRPLTKQKYASLCGNAAWYARQFVTKRDIGWRCLRSRRRHQWQAILLRRQQSEETLQGGRPPAIAPPVRSLYREMQQVRNSAGG